LPGFSFVSTTGCLVAFRRIPPMLATLGTLGAGLGVALLLMNGVNTATYALAQVADSHRFFGVSNLVVIALGVESRDDLPLLAKLGFDGATGPGVQ